MDVAITRRTSSHKKDTRCSRGFFMQGSCCLEPLHACFLFIQCSWCQETPPYLFPLHAVQQFTYTAGRSHTAEQATMASSAVPPLHLHCSSVAHRWNGGCSTAASTSTAGQSHTTDKWRQQSCIIFPLHCRSVLHHQRRAILGSKKSRPPQKSWEIADYMFCQLAKNNITN